MHSNSYNIFVSEQQNDSPCGFWQRFLWCLCDRGVQEWAPCAFELEMLLCVWSDLGEIRRFTQLQRKGREKTGNTNSITPRLLRWLEWHLIWFNYSHSPLSGGAPLPRLLMLLLSLVTGWRMLHQPLVRLCALRRWNFNDVLILIVKPFRGKW